MVRLVYDEFVTVIPGDVTQIQQAIVYELHGSALSGHLGWHKVDILVKKLF